MIYQDSIKYIKTSLAQGKRKEELYQELLSKGETIEKIGEYFTAIKREERKEGAQKRTIKIILTIGAILIGAGIFSFIAANWQEMTKSLKIGIIIISMLASYSAAWYVREKLRLVKTGEALLLLGAIIYGAGIFLTAQMFNIRANWPDGFILWMLGVIAMAFAAEAFSLFYLAIPLGIVAFIGHPFGIFTDFGPNPFLLTSSFLLLISTIVTFISGWTIHKKIPQP